MKNSIELKKIYFIVCLFFFSGCQEIKTMGKEPCVFNYDETIKNNIIIPYLEKKIGKETAKYFSVDKPVITQSGKISRVILSPTIRINEMMVMFENSYIFIFDNCSQLNIDVIEVIRN